MKSLFDRLEQRRRVEEIEERRYLLDVSRPSLTKITPSKQEPETVKPLHDAQGVKGRPKGHVSQCAIQLSWLVEKFLKQHPQIRAKAMTTGAVTYELIKPAVMEKGCRYVDLIENESRTAVSRGRFFFFISHGWGRPFIELVDQLVAHFKPENQAIWRPKGSPILQWHEIYVWLDIFAINQNEGASQGDDLSQLKEVVEDANQTLMILDKEGSVLTRIWCLFEAWHTGKKCRMGALRLLSYGVKWAALQKVFVDLDVSKAKATVIEDRDRILNEIAADVGVLTMTHQLKDALVDSVVADAPMIEDYEISLRSGQLFFKAAGLANMYGRYAVAEPLYRKAHHCYSTVKGPDHSDTMKPLTSLAILLKDQGRLEEAESLLQRSLSVRESLTDDFGQMTTLSLLGELYVLMGRLDEAEPLYHRVLNGRRIKLGDRHPYTLITLNSLACLYRDLGRMSESRDLFHQALSLQEELGAELPRTYLTICDYGELLRMEERLGEAQSFQQRALEGLNKVLGGTHPDTLLAAHRLASVFIDRGDFDAALPLCHRAFDGRIQVLGTTHRHTIDSKELLKKAMAH